MGEEWKPIPGFPGYEVSDMGRVMSYKRGTERVLSMPVGQCGYPQVRLSRGSRTSVTTHNVHALVLLAFVGPRPDGLISRHLNDIKTDNRLSNLAYGTLVDNAQDAILNGCNAGTKKAECLNGHPFDEENTYYRPRGSGRDCRECHRARNLAKRQGRAA